MNSKGKEVPHGVRLYSIASSRYGDSFDGKTTSLCVRRAVYWDPEMGREDPAKKGICSNFLCDAKPGQEINMTGESQSRARISPAHMASLAAVLCIPASCYCAACDVWRAKFATCCACCV